MKTRADDLPVEWFSSSYSNNQGGACVQGGRTHNGDMAVRDSKDPHGSAFVFPAATWCSFVKKIKSGKVGS